jgi:hypothetical protein
MNYQTNLFPTGQPSLRDMERIIAKMSPDYIRLVCETVLEVATVNPDFTAEDVRMHCEPKSGQENLFSYAMLEAKRLGIMKVVGYRNAARTQAKGRRIPVYERAFDL